VFYDLGGLDAGATVHFIGQMSNLEDPAHKIREWTTLDLIVNYTFNLPASAAQNEVAGYARDGGKNTELKDREAKSVMPVSTAEYNPCGWRAWLNNTTITLGMNNVFDQDPPFVAGSGESADEAVLKLLRHLETERTRRTILPFCLWRKIPSTAQKKMIRNLAMIVA
jgi:outer membrane receptor protein involved in Fe transport